MNEHLYLEIAIVIVGASLLAYLSVLVRLPVVLAYLLCGIIAGPWGLELVEKVNFLDQVSELGIALLLFLAGVELHPRRFGEILTKTAFVTVFSCFLTAGTLYWMTQLLGMDVKSGIFTAFALMFSSTILGIKLIPTTALHHQYLGAYCIAILILQDILAVGSIMVLNSLNSPSYWTYFAMLFKGVFLLFLAFSAEKYVLRTIMKQCEPIGETLYLFPLAWCLGISVIAGFLGFSHEIGAFIAGMALTRSPISQFLMEKLKLLRDFFLLFFFFCLGAHLNLKSLPEIAVPAFILCLMVVLFKVFFFYSGMRFVKENSSFSLQAAVRLSQASEFSIIMSMIGKNLNVIPLETAQLIQFTTILTFVFSSYLVSNFYRTPWSTPS